MERHERTRGATAPAGARRAVAALIAALALAAPPAVGQRASCIVERVVDGDTFVCRGGERVRLLLVDAPEMGDDARLPGGGPRVGVLVRSALAEMLPAGARVTLERDVGERDRYGRLLAHAHLEDGRWVNLELARRGLVRVMVVPPNVRHVETIRAEVEAARAGRVGLWAGEVWPSADASGSPVRPRAPAGSRPARAGCDASYPDVCIPPPPPDLDCADIPHRRFRVLAPDPHRFDGDRDGIGCEGGEDAVPVAPPPGPSPRGRRIAPHGPPPRPAAAGSAGPRTG